MNLCIHSLHIINSHLLERYLPQEFAAKVPSLGWAVWHVPVGVSMTNIGSHYTRPPGLVNLWPARSPGICTGRLNKASIVHIAPSDPLIRIVFQGMSWNLCLTSLPYKKDFGSNPTWSEAWINILTWQTHEAAYSLCFR